MGGFFNTLFYILTVYKKVAQIVQQNILYRFKEDIKKQVQFMVLSFKEEKIILNYTILIKKAKV